MASVQKRVPIPAQQRTWCAGTHRIAPSARGAGSARGRPLKRMRPSRPTRSCAGITFDPNEGKVLFRDAAAAWLASRPDLKETTRAAYRDALAPTDPSNAYLAKRHKPLTDLRIDAVFGGYPINAITATTSGSG